jgi:Protein of unknown function (DUF935)
MGFLDKVFKNFTPSTGSISRRTDPITSTQVEISGKKPSTYSVPLQLSRYRQDVASWRYAMEKAEQAYFPQRVDMQRMYYDTVLNGHVQACIQKRKNLTLLRTFEMVDANNNINEEWTNYFKSQWFYDLLGGVIDAQFFGYTLEQIGSIRNNRPVSMTSIARHNVSPDRLTIAQFPYDLAGLKFDDPNLVWAGGKPFDWTIYIPTPTDVGTSKCGFGLLYKIGIYEIQLRNLLGFNADYLQSYGQPLRVAKTNKLQGDPEYKQLENFLRNAGADAYIMLDPTDEIEFVEASSSSAAKSPFANFEERMIKFISKVALGHADAIDSTPGKLGNDSQNSPAQISLAEIQAVDGRMAESIVNYEAIPKLQNLGISIPQGLTFRFNNDQERIDQRANEDKNNLVVAQVAQTLKNSGFDVDEKYITDRTGITVSKSAPVEVAPTFDPSIKNKLASLYK